MLKFLSLNFWFNVWGGTLVSPLRNIFIVFIIVLLILTIVFTILKKRSSKTLYFKIYNQIQLFSLINFILALLLLFFTDQKIPLLSARFWFLLMAIEMIVSRYFIYKRYKKIPEIKEKIRKEKEFKKYIP